MELKLIEPIKNYTKEFNTTDEFNLWYSKNKSSIDSLTTHKLNKMFYIKGYRITKIKGILCLKRYEEKNKEEKKQQMILNNDSTMEALEEFHEEYIEEIKTMKETINKIIEFINGINQTSTLVSPPSIT